jgi:hypothetical protein
VHFRNRGARSPWGCDELRESGRELQPGAAEGAKPGRVRRIGATRDGSVVPQGTKHGARRGQERKAALRVMDLAPWGRREAQVTSAHFWNDERLP